MFKQYISYISGFFSSNFVLIIGMMVLILLLLIPKTSNKDLNKIYKVNTIELFIISSEWMLFFILLMIHKKSFINRTSWVLLFMFLEVIWSILAIYVIKKARKVKIHLISEFFKNNIEILVVIVLVLAIGLMHLNIPPMYDANLYYGELIKGLNSLTFELKSFLDSFTIWGKQFHPIAPILLLGETICAGTAKGIYFINILLLIGAVICVYEIVLENFKNVNKSQAAILGLVFAFSPFLMSGTIYITPDFYCAIFFVYMVFFYKKNWIWLFSYISLAFICMKRNMVITYIVFLMIAELKENLSLTRIKQIATERPLFLYVLPIEVMYFFYSYGTNATESMAQGQNTFFQKSVNRFFQAFILGYKWLFILLFIALLIIVIKKRGIDAILRAMEKHVFESAIVISSLTQFVVYEIFNQRLTLCSRYFAQNALMYIILIAFVFNSNYIKQKTRNLLSLGIAVICIVQLHQVIDPGMILFSDSIDFCGGKLYLGVTKYKDEMIGIGDNSAYNFSYALWSDIFINMLSDNKWSEDIKLYSSIDDEHLLGCADYRYGITFTGQYNVYWNDQKHNITYNNEGTNCHKLSIVSLTDEITAEQESALYKEDIIYLIVPDNMNDDIKKIICKSGYKETVNKEYCNRITKLNFIKLEKGQGE